MTPKKNNKKLRIILIIVLVLLIGVFAVAAAIVIRDTVRSKKEDAANREIVEDVRSLREQVMKDAETDDGADPSDTGDESGTGKKYRLLPGCYTSSGILRWLEPCYTDNKDLAGWLIIDGTYIDYPVMHTPYWVEKYLRKSFSGGYALSGTLFIGGKDWTPDSNYTVIYGHHMKDGTMFSDLVDYESLDYARSHMNIHFETLTDVFEYEVVFAINTQVGASTNSKSLDYFTFSSLPNKQTFDDFIARARSLALYDTGVDVKWGDRILVLSTCNYHKENERFIVIARYRDEEAQT